MEDISKTVIFTFLGAIVFYLGFMLVIAVSAIEKAKDVACGLIFVFAFLAVSWAVGDTIRMLANR